MHYVLRGSITVTTYGVGGINETYVLEAGDVGFVPKGFARYFAALDGPADILITFDNPFWTTQELSTWMAVSPSYITASSLNSTADVIENYFPKAEVDFCGSKVCGMSRQTPNGGKWFAKSTSRGIN